MGIQEMKAGIPNPAKKKIRKIAVLTSGGDAPGMNAAIRAVVRTARDNDIKVVGVMHGYAGLIRGKKKEDAEKELLVESKGKKNSKKKVKPDFDLFDMDVHSVSDIIHRGGTILFSARCEEFKKPEGILKAIETCRKNDIDGIVVIGGDGTFSGARDLTELSNGEIPCIGIPGTIDNDLGYTDYTVGYDTCLNTIMDMADRVRDTTESHDRCIVIEVMGRGAGFLALNAGIAVGAISILVPEWKFNVKKDVIDRIKKVKEETGKSHFIVVVAEGVCEDNKKKKRKKKPSEHWIENVKQLEKRIQDETGVETRSVVFGHVQRGGAPTCKDRVVASQMGYRAVELLIDGQSNRVVGLKNEEIIDLDIHEALNIKKTLDKNLLDISRKISI